MVVDDSEADRLFAQIMLERCGLPLEVRCFESARQALTCLQQVGHGVDLVLLDINMPGLDGWGFLDACAAAPQWLAGSPVVMLSSSPDPADQARAMAYPPVRGYITKPITRDAALGLAKLVSPLPGG